KKVSRVRRKSTAAFSVSRLTVILMVLWLFRPSRLQPDIARDRGAAQLGQSDGAPAANPGDSPHEPDQCVARGTGARSAQRCHLREPMGEAHDPSCDGSAVGRGLSGPWSRGTAL